MLRFTPPDEGVRGVSSFARLCLGALVGVVALSGCAQGTFLAALPNGINPTPFAEPSVTTPDSRDVPDDDPQNTVTVSFSLVGDMTFGTSRNIPPGGVGSVFDLVRGDLPSDITMGNLETVIGNFCGYYTFNINGATGLSGILHVTLDKQGNFIMGAMTPLKLVGAGTPTIDASGTSIDRVRQLSKDDFGKSAVGFDGDGTIQPPK